MAAQRLSRRFIRAALVGGPLLIAGVVCASPAHADEASYLTHLHNIGIQGVPGDAELVQDGRIICQQVRWGAPASEMQSLMLTDSQAHGISARQADAIVDYALVDLCPRA
jgi:hypothetical protein